MLTRNPQEFFDFVAAIPRDLPATARAAFLVSPLGFGRAEQSAADNVYMASSTEAYDASRALLQHQHLQSALRAELPVIAFPGNDATPDAVFPNNAFATAASRLIVGRMRHEVRQEETCREDIRSFFRDVLGYSCVDLSLQDHAAELTGSLVMDRSRGIGFIGLSERCDEQGAHLMHEAFGLRASLMFDLAPGEYHTNVVLSVLAGHAVVICPKGFASADVPHAIEQFYAPAAVVCSDTEHAAFVGNCIALSEDAVWMSERAAAALSPSNRLTLENAGFAVKSVELDAIEAAGGSLRCCVGEIF